MNADVFVPVDSSHTFVLLSPLPVTSKAPSTLKARHVTWEPCAWKDSMGLPLDQVLGVHSLTLCRVRGGGQADGKQVALVRWACMCKQMQWQEAMVVKPGGWVQCAYAICRQADLRAQPFASVAATGLSTTHCNTSKQQHTHLINTAHCQDLAVRAPADDPHQRRMWQRHQRLPHRRVRAVPDTHGLIVAARGKQHSIGAELKRADGVSVALQLLHTAGTALLIRARTSG